MLTVTAPPERICTSCYQDSVVFDNVDVHGYVCYNCGTVIDDSVIADDVLEFNRDSRCPNGLVIDQIVGERGGMAITRPGSLLSRRHFSVAHHDSNVQRDRRITSAHRRVDEQVRIFIEALRIPHHLFNSIKGMTLAAVSEEITKQKKVDTTIAVCTYIVCRQNNQPIQLLDAADIVNMNVFKLGAHYKRISQQLNIHLEVQDPAILTEKVIGDLEAELSCLDQTAKMKLMQQTSRLIQMARKEWLDTGRKPISLVAAAVKIVVSGSDIDLNINDIAKRIGVGSLSIRDRFRELQNMIVKLSAPLPWAKEINKKTLPRYLPFILEYLESLRELTRIPVKALPEPKDEEKENPKSPSTPTEKELPLQLESHDKPEKVQQPSQPVLVSRKRKSRGSQQKSVDEILLNVNAAVPPSFIRSQLERQMRVQKIIRAKKRMHEESTNQIVDDEDVAIEKLLKAGLSEQTIQEGYYHVATPIPNRALLDSEELCEEDLSEMEYQRYTKSAEQVAIEMELRGMLGEDIDGEISAKRAKKKQRLN
jgi:transcription initiation factor TFIIIB Brf1 subunit/transcription initiation factor TFIIB